MNNLGSKIKKGLELVFRPYFSHFLIKLFLLQCYINWPGFITRLCLLSKLFGKIDLMFGAYIFDDVMASDYLKSQNLIISRTKELLKRNKKHFSLLHKCSLLDLQNKLAKT